VTSPASCGGKDGKAKMAPNNFTFKWSDGSDADVRLDLAAGTYIVTVTDAQGCTAEVAVKILDGCGQKILALAKDLEVKQVACNTTDYEYCLDLDLIDLYLGGYEVFDNGVSMKNSMKPCEVRRHHEYVLDGVEDYQNVTLEEWSIEGKTYSGTFNTLQELVVLMNKWDNSVIWTVDNITSTIEAINANQNRYGTMKLKLTDGSGLSWDFGVSEYTSAHGLKIPFDMGLHRIELVHKITNYRDTTLLNLVCTTPSTFELDLEEGEHKEVDISTTELVGKKCVVKVCAGDPNNPAAEFHAMPNKEAMIMVDAMEKGWERTVYTMCDEYNVCDTATIKVSVREKQIPVQPVDSTIVIYNGFSPNDDGQNDVFLIKNIEFFPNSTLTIYNRWGNSVFSTKAYQNNWKGTFDEKALPDGTYFYVLEVKGQKTRSGYVELRR
jgi:gliding motility-associated-like protein